MRTQTTYIVLVKDGIFHACISRVTNGPFGNKNQLALPYSEYRHSINTAVFKIEGPRENCE